MSREAHKAVEQHAFADPVTGKPSIRDKQLLLLYCMAYNADPNGVAWVSMERLASYVRTSKRHIIRLIKELEEKGYLSVRRPAKVGRGRANVYVLKLAMLDSALGESRASELGHLLDRGLSIREAALFQKGDNTAEKGDMTTRDLRHTSVIENTNTHNTHVNETASRKSQRVMQPIPDSFPLTDEMRRWAEVNCPEIDVEAETAEFVSYWREGDGKGFERADWHAAWRKRMLAQAQFRRGNPARGASSIEGGGRDDLEGAKSVSRSTGRQDRRSRAGGRGGPGHGSELKPAKLVIRGSIGLDTVTR